MLSENLFIGHRNTSCLNTYIIIYGSKVIYSVYVYSFTVCVVFTVYYVNITPSTLLCIVYSLMFPSVWVVNVVLI